MIQLEHIHKTFAGKSILNDFSLNVKEGEFVAIMGSSGSGKTTILNIIGLLTQPDLGVVTIMGIRNPNKKQIQNLRRYHLGYIFQNYVLINNETVEKNLEISKKHNSDFTFDAVKETLTMVGLNETFLKKKIYELSGGEQQRIAIARTLLKKCTIILADEPTGNLDFGNKMEMISLFTKLKNIGKTIVCVTHDNEVGKSADRIIHLTD